MFFSLHFSDKNNGNSSYIGVRLGPPPHNIYDVRSFQRPFSAGLSGHELPAIDDFNGSKAATEGVNKTENRQSLWYETSINQQKNYWCLTCFWTGWLFRTNHGDHFELFNARTAATRPRNSVAASWLLNSRTVATICSVSILSHSTLCLRWQPMGSDGGWRGSSHVHWLFSSQTPIWNCFPTWSSKINKDIQSKGSKWYPKWEVRIWSEANENVAHPRIIWFTPLLPMVKSNPSLDLNGHLT